MKMFKKTKLWAIMLIVLMMMSVAAGCRAQKQENEVTLATTTSTQDSGLLEALAPAFEKKYSVKVKVVAVGSGAAMEMAKKGDADVLLVHSPKAEEELMAGGFGDSRKSVMHNEFLIVGPAKDPAGIKGVTSAVDALKKIADTKSAFISRGDNSGTHNKEKGLWAKAQITPEGTWYVQSGQGMGETLIMANEMGGYTLTDLATYLSMKNKSGLIVIVRGDKALSNPYSVITVSKTKFPQIHFDAAAKFSEFVTSSEGQAIIREFGKAEHGEPLFIPDVK
ncbi:MAG: tungsten ABC transporter substrate-binding protein [Firmicutes bacterium HGW-Firmicutes-8]|nr:MAG: tungsten ABC transporter substrate-binding protein [Firmicutes bacterium HGW-Firmicutes-8]